MRGALRYLLAALFAASVYSTAEAANVVAGQFFVQTAVSPQCKLQNPANIDLGIYDTLGSGTVSGQSTMGVQCTKCTDGKGNNKCQAGNKQLYYSISMTSANGWNMKNGEHAIPYILYQPDGTVWNETSVVSNVPGTNTWQYYIITARTVFGVDVPAGTYSDTVTMTVTY